MLKSKTKGKMVRIVEITGYIFVIVGPYLIVIVSSKIVGHFDESLIYEVVEWDIIPFTKSTMHLSEPQVTIMVWWVDTLL